MRRGTELLFKTKNSEWYTIITPWKRLSALEKDLFIVIYIGGNN